MFEKFLGFFLYVNIGFQLSNIEISFLDIFRYRAALVCGMFQLIAVSPNYTGYISLLIGRKNVSVYF